MASRKQALKHAIMEAGSENVAATMLFHNAMAQCVGLTVSDYKALDLVLRKSPLTAGEIASETGLTTGAVTGLVDRLERAGFVKRTRDSRDRRKVIINPSRATMEKRIQERFESFGRALDQLLDSYTENELAAIFDYTTGLYKIMREEAGKQDGSGSWNTDEGRLHP